MRKICLFLAVLFVFLSVASCAPSLESLPEKTEPPVTTTKKPVRSEQEKTEEKKIMQEYDPKEDGVINILMIGHSFCYYYVEELYGIAKAAGVEMKVCNVYYSGCSIQRHWTWWKSNERNYKYFETDGGGRKQFESYSLKMCLERENWDVISFQRGSADYPNAKKEKTYRYLGDLLDYVKSEFPLSTYYWHHTWAVQVGYDRNGTVMDTVEKQTASALEKREASLEYCKDFGLIYIPSGDAWQYARQDSRVGDVLCNRGKKSDNYHDGEEGGGQYLNACIWFETLTGQSCIGNTWRPDTYELSESMIAALQQAAHRAVAESRA